MRNIYFLRASIVYKDKESNQRLTAIIALAGCSKNSDIIACTVLELDVY